MTPCNVVDVDFGRCQLEYGHRGPHNWKYRRLAELDEFDVRDFIDPEPQTNKAPGSQEGE
jgi:hypothetical protein